MNISILKNNLNNFSSILMMIVSKGNLESIVSNLKMETKEENNQSFLNIDVTNYETLLNLKIEIELEEKGDVCVSANKFINLIKEYPSSLIKIESDPMKQWVNINCDSLETKLPSIDPKLFPKLEWQQLDNFFEISCEKLCRAIKKTVECVPENTNKNYLRGLCVRYLEGNQFEFCSSDSMRISRSVLDMDHLEGSYFSMIIPRKSCFDIISVLEKEKGVCRVYCDENVILIKTENISYQSQLIRDNFPDVKRYFGRISPNVLYVNREKFIRFLRILKAMSDDHLNSIKILFKQGFIEILGQKSLTEAIDKIDCEFDGNLEEIGFNVKILYEGLSFFQESNDETIEMHLGNIKQPCIIRAQDIRDFQHLCMPMEISW